MELLLLQLAWFDETTNVDFTESENLRFKYFRVRGGAAPESEVELIQPVGIPRS